MIKRWLKPLPRNKRAVSPAISSVIMSAAIITVGLCVLAWANNNFAAKQQESSEFFNTQSQLISENFMTEDVWFYPNGVNVTVRNIGTNDLSVASIEFNQTNHLGSEQSIPVGQARTIIINWNWGSGKLFYNVQVETAREQSITEIFCTTE